MYRGSNGSRNDWSYRAQSRVFLAKASENIQNDDLTMASENGWGAAALIMKAVAEDRGWEHYGERLLYDITDRLIEEAGDQDLRHLFTSVDKLHTNFYEDQLSREAVEDLLRDAARFVTRVERLLDTSQTGSV